MQASHRLPERPRHRGRTASIRKGLRGKSASTTAPPVQSKENVRTNFPKKGCTVCRQSHELEDCRTFKGFSTRERLEHLRRSGACFFCLEAGHSTRDCRIARRCEIGGCSRFHHKLLHEGGATVAVPGTGAIPRNSDFRATGPREGNVHTSHNSEKKTPHAIFLGAIRLPVQDREGNTITSTIMLDEGSDITLIREGLAEKIQLGGIKEALRLSRVTGRNSKVQSRMVKIQLNIEGREVVIKAYSVFLHCTECALNHGCFIQRYRSDPAMYNTIHSTKIQPETVFSLY